MPYGLYISAEGAQVQSQRMEHLANNLANLETPGFKRDLPTFQARFAEAIQRGQSMPGDGSENDLGGGVKLMEVKTDFSHSTLRHTKMPTDFAVNGDGFFRVLTEDGNELLTRAGNFALNSVGRLITQTGLPVLDDGGAAIELDPDQPWEVQANGRIVQGDESTPIGLLRAENVDELVKVGRNLFRPLGETAPVPEAERDVRQGYLEQSGVNSTREMMALIETSRAFEANTKLIQHQDSMLGNLISRVLATS